jgi:hypothetical protein
MWMTISQIKNMICCAVCITSLLVSDASVLYTVVQTNILAGDCLQVAKVSCFPQCWVFEGSGMDLSHWTEHTEHFWEKHMDAILNTKVHNNLCSPLNVTEWQSKLTGLANP